MGCDVRRLYAEVLRLISEELVVTIQARLSPSIDTLELLIS
jgi:hypothetical protein